MIQLKVKDKSYELPLQHGTVTGGCTLDENWRKLDYKNKDSSLSLSVVLTYEVPLACTDALFDLGLVNISSVDIEENEKNLLILNLDINHSDYDFKSGKVLMHNGFPTFPELSFLVGYEFLKVTLANSTLWFPAFGVPAVFTMMKFGDLLSGTRIGFQCEGKVKDAVAEMDFCIQELELPFLFSFEIKGYAEEFIGFSRADKIKEIQDCFASVYDIDAFLAEIVHTDITFKGVRINYRLK